MFLAEVKVPAELVDSHKVWVVESNLFGSGEDEVLCNFDAESCDSVEEDFHGHELALGLVAVDG